jgi:RND family efflux transporter MFP subunit
VNYSISRSTFALVITALLLGTSFACSRNNDAAPSGMPGFGGPGGFVRSTTVEVREVQTAEISDQIRSFGTVRAQDNVRVTPQINMNIRAIRADLGDTVRTGQVLAVLFDEPFVEVVRRDETQLEQARSAVQRDSTNLSRQLELFNLQLISQAELDNARTAYLSSRAALQSARSALANSRQNLGYTQVRSPVNGVVTRRLASPGDVVGPSQTVFEISNLAGYEIRVNLPLRDWAQTVIGQQVDLRLSGTEGFNARGTVTRISPELDPVTGLGEVVISVTDRGANMFPGVLVEARINVETKTNALVIPRSAMVENVQTVIDPESNVIRLSRSFAAFVSQGDTIAVRRNLDLGIQQGDRIEVLSGLAAGDKLIITGQSSLEDGSRIRISGAPRFQPGGGPPQGIQGGGMPGGAQPGGARPGGQGGAGTGSAEGSAGTQAGSTAGQPGQPGTQTAPDTTRQQRGDGSGRMGRQGTSGNN